MILPFQIFISNNTKNNSDSQQKKRTYILLNVLTVSDTFAKSMWLHIQYFGKSIALKKSKLTLSFFFKLTLTCQNQV